MTETSEQIKILITSSGQHIVGKLIDADLEKDLERDYYVVIDPMLIHYHPIGDSLRDGVYTPGKLEASFMRFCPLSSENVFDLRKDWIVSITDPDKSVLESYQNTLNPPSIEVKYHDSNTSTPE